MQQVGPRSYQVDVEGTYYLRNLVNLGGRWHHPEQHDEQQDSLPQPPVEQPASPPQDVGDMVTGCATRAQEVRLQGQSGLHQPVSDSPRTPGYRIASGRLVKVPKRLDL